MKLFSLPIYLVLFGWLQAVNVAYAQSANDSSLIFPVDTKGNINLDAVLQSSHFTSKQVPSWWGECLVAFSITVDESGVAHIVSAETLNDSAEFVPFTDSVVIDSIARILASTPITRLWMGGTIAPVDITKTYYFTALVNHPTVSKPHRSSSKSHRFASELPGTVSVPRDFEAKPWNTTEHVSRQMVRSMSFRWGFEIGMTGTAAYTRSGTPAKLNVANSLVVCLPNQWGVGLLANYLGAGETPKAGYLLADSAVQTIGICAIRYLDKAHATRLQAEIADARVKGRTKAENGKYPDVLHGLSYGVTADFNVLPFISAGDGYSLFRYSLDAHIGVRAASFWERPGKFYPEAEVGIGLRMSCLW